MGLSKYLKILPFFYFFQTRIVFNFNFILQFICEIGTSIIIFLFLLKPLYLDAIFLFILHYLAFISLYEIGYFINDTISVNYEKKPNKRFKIKKSIFFNFLFIILRLIFFILLTFYLDLQNSYLWWFFYFFLIIIFSIHNFLSQVFLRLATFQILSFLRFIAPFFSILDTNYFFIIGNIVALTYVPYRTLGYLVSKKITYKNISRNYLFQLLTFLPPIVFFLVIIILKFN